jgi:hypothetical protein
VCTATRNWKQLDEQQLFDHNSHVMLCPSCEAVGRLLLPRESHLEHIVGDAAPVLCCDGAGRPKPLRTQSASAARSVQHGCNERRIPPAAQSAGADGRRSRRKTLLGCPWNVMGACAHPWVRLAGAWPTLCLPSGMQQTSLSCLCMLAGGDIGILLYAHSPLISLLRS